jgi:hypothetical protein
MCGDMEEEDSEAERLYAAFVHAANSVLHEVVEHRGGSRRLLDDSPGSLADVVLHRYMDGLFGDILKACIEDGRRVSVPERYRVLASQAVVLARAAGFIAGQLDPRDDPLKNSISALLAGYEAQDLPPDRHATDGGHQHRSESSPRPLGNGTP